MISKNYVTPFRCGSFKNLEPIPLAEGCLLSLQPSSHYLQVRPICSQCHSLPHDFNFHLGHGKCGVSVIRISGVKASETILEMTNRKDLPKPRMAVLHHIKDPVTHEQLDKGLILWFPGNTYFNNTNLKKLRRKFIKF